MMQNLSNTPFGKFIWFVGVIEDVNDPEGIDRVRVRAIGFHSEDKTEVPTEDLPWAPVLQSPANMSAPMYLPSDWVIGFFMDGETAQQPIILGVITGIPQERRSPDEVGFSDPNNFYPRNVGEGSNSRLARGVPSNVAKAAQAAAVSGIPSANKSSWSEPESPFAAQYPQNHVFETDAGHAIELDDTLGNERIRVMHATGAFFEIHPSGEVVYRASNNRYDVTFAEHNIFVKGNINITAGAGVNIVAGGDTNISTSGNVNWRVGGDFNLEAGGKTNIVSGGNVNVEGAKVNLNSGEASASLGAPDGVPDVGSPGDSQLAQRPGSRVTTTSEEIPEGVVDDKPPAETPKDLPKEVPKTTGQRDGEDAMIRAMNRAGLKDECLRAQIMAQAAHESGNFRSRTENLNYSAQGLINTWPTRFNSSNAQAYHRQPEKIANKVYSNRMGNGSEASGDGWKYRGRGFIQLTGKSNYIAASRGLGVNFVNNPEAAASDPYAADLAVWYCTKLRRFPNPCDVKSSTKVVNGGFHGLADRQAKFAKYRNDPKVIKYDPKYV